MRRLVISSGLAVLLLLPASPAFAEPSAADRDSARTLMNEGDRRMEAGDAVGALESYTAAHAIMGVPTTGAAAASAYLKLGKVVEARDLCLAVQRYPKSPTEPAAFGAARMRCDGLLGGLEGRAASVRIEVKGLAAGVTPAIKIDGEIVPFAALKVPRKVNPGNHTIIASAPGYADASVTVAVVEGSTREVTLLFTDSAGRPGPVAAGPSGETGAARFDTAPPKSGPRPPAIAAFAVGTIGLAVGGITGALSLSKVNEAKADCVGNVCPTRNRDDADAARNLGTVSNIGFGVGIAGVVLGAVLWATGKNDAPVKAAAGWSNTTVGGTF